MSLNLHQKIAREERDLNINMSNKIEEYDHKMINLEKDLNKNFNHKIEVLSQTEQSKFSKLQEADRATLLQQIKADQLEEKQKVEAVKVEAEKRLKQEMDAQISKDEIRLSKSQKQQ